MKTVEQMIEVMTAFKQGKQVQWRWTNDSSDNWRDLSKSDWDWCRADYRIKPEPKLRPWKSEEVPVGAVVKFRMDNRRFVILACFKNNVCMASDSFHEIESYPLDIFNGETYSLDHGKTWLPCGVLE